MSNQRSVAVAAAVVATAATLILAPGPARAATPVDEPSCDDAFAAKLTHAQCRLVLSEAHCAVRAPAPIAQCWDFERDLGDHGFGGWVASGTAFRGQPTFGDNVSAERALAREASPTHAGATVLADLGQIGGDYWKVPYPIGHERTGWVGSFEDQSAPGGVKGDGPTGTLVSPAFVVERDLVTFLIGGSCDPDIAVRLEVESGGNFYPSIDPLGRPLSVTGPCDERMRRITFFTDGDSRLRGLTVRLAVRDDSARGHVSVDHVLHTDRAPADVGGANVPLWGFADTHAHPGNHQAFQALSSRGHALDGNPEAPGVCDGGEHGAYVHRGGQILTHSTETASLGHTTAMPAGCTGSGCLYPQREPNFAAGVDRHDPGRGSPYWYSRAHQQMTVEWMERAYQGGQRLMIASAGNAELLGAVLRDSHFDQFVSDYGAMRRFAAYLKYLTARHPWMEIAYTPADARRIVAGNRLAIILGTEVDDLGDNCAADIGSPDGSADGGSTTTTMRGQNPWDEVKVSTSCATDDEWRARIASLYRAGYRAIIPVHFADNDLGGPAIYSELHQTLNRFLNRAFFSVGFSEAVDFRLSPNPGVIGWCDWSPVNGCFAAGGQGGLLALTFLGPIGIEIEMMLAGTHGAVSTPVPMGGTVQLPIPPAIVPTPTYQGPGHVNTRPLTTRGLAVLRAMMARGMIIDVSHLDEVGRNQVLGLGATASTASIVSPGCDLDDPACQATAYPVIASHAGLREMSLPLDRNEGGLTLAMIRRIIAIGGTVAVGTAGGDTRSTDEAAPDGPTSGVFAATVANDCAGSTRTFAQSYLYALRRTGGGGITIGSDLNGLEAQLNPRFGTMGCYARGNVPRIVQFAHDGTVLIDENHVWAVDHTRGVPFNYRPGLLRDFRRLGTAGGQRLLQRNATGLGAGLNYAHYNGVPPSGGAAAAGKYLGLVDPPDYDTQMLLGNFQQPLPTAFDTRSMSALAATPPMTALVTGGRRFDFNYDGLANYGLLPDLLQDARGVGLSTAQLAPLFRGAESVVSAWEKACRLSDPTESELGCR